LVTNIVLDPTALAGLPLIQLSKYLEVKNIKHIK